MPNCKVCGTHTNVAFPGPADFLCDDHLRLAHEAHQRKEEAHQRGFMLSLAAALIFTLLLQTFGTAGMDFVMAGLVTAVILAVGYRYRRAIDRWSSK